MKLWDEGLWNEAQLRLDREILKADNDREQERNQHDYEHANLTLSCGCSWDFTIWRYVNECPTHRKSKLVMEPLPDDAHDLEFKREFKRLGSKTNWGE